MSIWQNASKATATTTIAANTVVFMFARAGRAGQQQQLVALDSQLCHFSSSPQRSTRILDDDDPRERQRLIGRGNLACRLCVGASAAMSTDPLTVRIDLDAG
jgi:hypothetical protein